MSNDNTVLLAALAVGAVIYINKKGAVSGAAGIKQGTTAQPTVNVQNSLWTSLLGTGWTMLKDATNSDGSAAFLEKNFLGQTVTSDGKPVGGELQSMFPGLYGGFLPVDTTAASGGVNYLGDLFSFSAYE